MKRLVGKVAFVAVTTASSAAFAQNANAEPTAPEPAAPAAPAPPTDDTTFPVKTTRRYGFTMGLGSSVGLTAASGSLIKFSQRDNVVTPGPAFVRRAAFNVGGVFTDWFAFHVGYSQTTASKSGYDITGAAFELGVETWPLFWKGGVFRDLGVGFDFATGTARIEKNGERVATGGSTSGIRGSLFWDAVSLWKIDVGPVLSYERRDGEVYRENLYTLGLRAAFYGVNKR